jgi:hypothetical protein
MGGIGAPKQAVYLFSDSALASQKLEQMLVFGGDPRQPHTLCHLGFETSASWVRAYLWLDTSPFMRVVVFEKDYTGDSRILLEVLKREFPSQVLVVVGSSIYDSILAYSKAQAKCNVISVEKGVIAPQEGVWQLGLKDDVSSAVDALHNETCFHILRGMGREATVQTREAAVQSAADPAVVREPAVRKPAVRIKAAVQEPAARASTSVLEIYPTTQPRPKISIISRTIESATVTETRRKEEMPETVAKPAEIMDLAPSITILAPAQNSLVVSDRLMVNFRFENFNISQTQVLCMSIDDRLPLKCHQHHGLAPNRSNHYLEFITPNDVGFGKHTLIAGIMQDLSGTLQPVAVSQLVHFTYTSVAESTKAACTPQTPKSGRRIFDGENAAAVAADMYSYYQRHTHFLTITRPWCLHHQGCPNTNPSHPTPF